MYARAVLEAAEPLLRAVQDGDVIQREVGVAAVRLDAVGVLVHAVERETRDRHVHVACDVEHLLAGSICSGNDLVAGAVERQRLGDVLRAAEARDVHHQRHRVAGLLRLLDRVGERRVDRLVVCRAGQARLDRADVGHAHLVVPDELGRVAGRFALIVNKLNRHARLVLRRINSVRRVPDDDRRASRSLILRQLDGHVVHHDAGTDLDRLRDAGHVEDERIVVRAHHEVLEQARVVGVRDRSRERVVVSVHGEVRVLEGEGVGQDRVRQEAHLDGRLRRVHADRTHDRLAVVDDVVPAERGSAREAGVLLEAVVPFVGIDLERVGIEAGGHVHGIEHLLHLRPVVRIGHVQRAQHAHEEQVRVGRILRVRDGRRGAVREDDGPALVEDAREREARVRLAAREGREIALELEGGAVHVHARAVLESAEPLLRAVQDGDVLQREVGFAERLDAVGVLVHAVDRDVLDRHVDVTRHVEHLLAGGVGVRDDLVARAVEREGLADDLRVGEVFDVHQQRHRVAAVGGEFDRVRERRVDRLFVRRTGETRLARADVGNAEFVVPDQRAVARAAGDLDDDLLVHGCRRAFAGRPREHRRAGRGLLVRQLDDDVRHVHAVAEMDGVAHLRHVERQRLLFRAEHDVLDDARVVGVLDRAAHRVVGAVDGQVLIAELEHIVAKVDVAVQRQLHGHIVGILADGVQHRRARVNDLVPVADGPARGGRVGVAEERDTRVDRQRVAAEARRERHARQRRVARHVRHVEDRTGLHERLVLRVVELNHVRARLAHDVHERELQRLPCHLREIHAPGRFRHGLAPVRAALSVRRHDDIVAQHRHAGSGQRAAVQMNIAPLAAADRHVRDFHGRPARDVEGVDHAVAVQRHVFHRHRRAGVHLRHAGDRVVAGGERDALVDRHALLHVGEQFDRVAVLRGPHGVVQRLVLPDEFEAIVIHRRDVLAGLDRVETRCCVVYSRDVPFRTILLCYRPVEDASGNGDRAVSTGIGGEGAERAVGDRNGSGLRIDVLVELAFIDRDAAGGRPCGDVVAEIGVFTVHDNRIIIDRAVLVTVRNRQRRIRHINIAVRHVQGPAARIVFAHAARHDAVRCLN